MWDQNRCYTDSSNSFDIQIHQIRAELQRVQSSSSPRIIHSEEYLLLYPTTTGLSKCLVNQDTFKPTSNGKPNDAMDDDKNDNRLRPYRERVGIPTVAVGTTTNN
jgi:hypothetical protein